MNGRRAFATAVAAAALGGPWSLRAQTPAKNARIGALFSGTQAGWVPSMVAGAAQTPGVFVPGSDPVALGLVATLQRPGGNATGHVSPPPEIAVEQLGPLRELTPVRKAHRAAVRGRQCPHAAHRARDRSGGKAAGPGRAPHGAAGLAGHGGDAIHAVARTSAAGCATKLLH